ncbi:sensor domain-containing diguanylate cyclase [Crenobacter cavernae]|uniref:sensor domain-containing diguanylate cyclase n=1 Tax=Crenobacter cavernae TaxID=2290923 RepID=UPI001F0BD464|nr:diguanylate cyclase [Crenobacter cavernae]
MREHVRLNPGWTWLVVVPAVALGYWAVGLFGTHYFARYGLMPAPIWLPSALAFAAAWRFGAAGLVGLFLGSMAINGVSQAQPLGDALTLSLANSIGPWLGVHLLQRHVGNRPPFFSTRDVWHFLWTAVGLAALITSFGGALVLSWNGALLSQSFLFTAMRWWLSDASGTLLFAPVMMLWLLPLQRPDLLPKISLSERAGLTAVVLLSSFLVLSLLSNPSGLYSGLPYLLLLPISWAAARVPLRYAHLLASLVSVLAIVGAVEERGAFFVDSNSQALTAAGLMIVSQTVILLVVGALVMERRLAEDRLRVANQSLEEKVIERTRQLAESESRFKLVADASPFPMVMNRLSDGGVIYANPRAEALFHRRLFAERALYVQDFYVDPANRDQVAALLQVQGQVNDIEVELQDADGRTFWALLSCQLVRFDGSRYVLTGINDISERKALEQRLHSANAALKRQVEEIESLQQGLKEQAVRDPLTGLFNRRYLDESIGRVLAHFAALSRPVSLMMLDVDHFKQVNDRHGHCAGDKVLSTLGALLSDRFRSGDIVCRFGGEEFIAVMPGSSLADARIKCERLREELQNTPMLLPDGSELRLTVSIGVAAMPEQGDDAESLIDAADTSLYAAKSGGRNRVCTAEPYNWEAVNDA